MTLGEAIVAGDVSTALALVTGDADVNEADEFGLTPLHLAVVHGQHELLDPLAAAKVKVNAKTTAMLNTIRLRDSRVMRPSGGTFFRPSTEPPIGPDRAFDKGATPLHLAATLGDLRAVEALLDAKARPAMKDAVGATALHLAALGGHASVVSRLLESKFEINGPTKVRKSILFYDQGVTPLMAALESGDRRCIELIADAGGDWRMSTKFGCTTLFFAARGGDVASLESLRAAGVAISDAPAEYNNFPLREAVAGGHHDAARRLLELGAATHESPNGSQAALRLAIERNDQTMRDLLLAGGAAPLPDHGIGHAAGGNDVGYIEAYVKGGGDLDARDHGMTPLMRAAADRHLAATQALIAGGANVSAEAGQGTALHYALAHDQAEIVDALLAAGTDCAIVDQHGSSPLHRLASSKLDSPQRCARMMELGANPHSVNRHGGSVIAALRQSGQDARADALAAAPAESAVDASFKEATEALRNASESESWKKVFPRLFDELVPPSGPAKTQQGELVRCIGSLTDEAYRNGNINWSDRHVAMVDALASTLSDGTLSGPRWDGLAGALTKLKHYRSPDVSGDGSPHYVVSEAVVAWCLQHREPLPR